MRIDKTLVIACFVVGCFCRVFAEPNPDATPIPKELECKSLDIALEHVREQKKTKTIRLQ